LGTLALVGGGEFTEGCADLDRSLIEIAGAAEAVVVPTARAFEHPDRAIEAAAKWFAGLGVEVRGLRVLRRADAEEAEVAAVARAARLLYITDGSPLHLRSVLKDSALFEAIRDAYEAGAVLAASGAGATVVCDPMVDPRGGAYTVGLGLVRGLAVFPYHGTAADHLRERSIELLPPGARLAGVDERTALVRDPDGSWRAAGAGAVTLYSRAGEEGRYCGEPVAALAGV
jgi:cyanophycinase